MIKLKQNSARLLIYAFNVLIGIVLKFYHEIQLSNIIRNLTVPGYLRRNPLNADGKMHFASYYRNSTIIRKGKEFDIINPILLYDKTGVPPLAVDDKLLIRTQSHLYSFIELTE